MWPIQLGVGVPLGSEIAVHTLRNWYERNINVKGKVILKLDIKNAFNSIDREACIRQIRTHAPYVSKWIEWCYENPSRLLFHDTFIMSETGVQ